MIIKKCELYDNKVCDGCGECDVCDLDPSKECTNCGKCLEGYDYTGIQIDDLMVEGSDDIQDDEDDWKFGETSDQDIESSTIFIDDVEGLSEEIEEHAGEDDHEHECEHDHEHPFH